MQQVPADIVRYWNTYGNKPVREILQACRVNRQLRDALCRSQAFWEGLVQQRLTGEDVIVKGQDIREMQEELDTLDRVYERLERLKTYTGEADTAQERDDRYFVLGMLERIAAEGGKRPAEKILSTPETYYYYPDVVSALVAGALQSQDDTLLNEILAVAIRQRIRLDAFHIGDVAAQHGRSDMIDRARAWPQDPNIFDLDSFNRRIVNSGVEYLATHPDNTQFRDYLLERFLQNQPDMQDEAFLVALKSDYADFIERYRDTVNPDFLVDVISSEMEGGDPALIHQLIEYIPNQDLPDLLSIAIEANNADILEHLLERAHDTPQMITDAIAESLGRNDSWNSTVREILLPYMTDEQRKAL